MALLTDNIYLQQSKIYFWEIFIFYFDYETF